jgi:hypothetical protein
MDARKASIDMPKASTAIATGDIGAALRLDDSGEIGVAD